MNDSTLIDVLLIAAITIIVFVLAVAVVRTTDDKMTIEQCLKATVILQKAEGKQ